MISLEKWKILTPLQKLPKNVGDLGKLIVTKGFKKLPKVQKIATSGHTAWVIKCNMSVSISWLIGVCALGENLSYIYAVHSGLSASHKFIRYFITYELGINFYFSQYPFH